MGFVEDRLEEIRRKAEAERQRKLIENARGGIGSTTTTGATGPPPALREELAQRNDQQATIKLPPPVRIAPMEQMQKSLQAVRSAHSDAPDEVTLKDLAANANKIADFVDQKYGGQLLPDVLLAMAMTGASIPVIAKLINPKTIVALSQKVAENQPKPTPGQAMPTPTANLAPSIDVIQGLGKAAGVEPPAPEPPRTGRLGEAKVGQLAKIDGETKSAAAAQVEGPESSFTEIDPVLLAEENKSKWQKLQEAFADTKSQIAEAFAQPYINELTGQMDQINTATKQRTEAKTQLQTMIDTDGADVRVMLGEEEISATDAMARIDADLATLTSAKGQQKKQITDVVDQAAADEDVLESRDKFMTNRWEELKKQEAPILSLLSGTDPGAGRPVVFGEYDYQMAKAKYGDKVHDLPSDVREKTGAMGWIDRPWEEGELNKIADSQDFWAKHGGPAPFAVSGQDVLKNYEAWIAGSKQPEIMGKTKGLAKVFNLIGMDGKAAANPDQIKQLRLYINANYYDYQTKQPLYPVAVNGWADTDLVVALLNINRDKASAVAALFPEMTEVRTKADNYLDSYMATLYKLSTDPKTKDWFNNAPDTTGLVLAENNPGLTPEERADFKAKRQAQVRGLSPLIGQLDNYFKGSLLPTNVADPAKMTPDQIRESVINYKPWELSAEELRTRLNDVHPSRFNDYFPDIASTSDRATAEGAKKALFYKVIALADPGVSPSEIAYWWKENVPMGDLSLPKEIKGQYLVGQSQIMSNAIGKINDVPGAVIGAAYEAALPQSWQDGLAVVGDNIAEAMTPLTAMSGAAAGAAVEVGGAALGAAAKPITVPLEIAQKAAMAVMIHDEISMSQDMEEMIKRKTGRDVDLNPYSGMKLDGDLGHLNSWVKDWERAWDVSEQLQEQGESMATMAFREMGFDPDSLKAMTLTVDLAFELVVLKGMGKVAKGVRAVAIDPALNRAGLALPWVKPITKRLVVEYGKAKDEHAAMQKMAGMYSSPQDFTTAYEAATGPDRLIMEKLLRRGGLSIDDIKVSNVTAGGDEPFIAAMTDAKAAVFDGIDAGVVEALVPEVGMDPSGKLLEQIRVGASSGDDLDNVILNFGKPTAEEYAASQEAVAAGYSEGIQEAVKASPELEWIGDEGINVTSFFKDSLKKTAIRQTSIKLAESENFGGATKWMRSMLKPIEVGADHKLFHKSGDYGLLRRLGESSGQFRQEELNDFISRYHNLGADEFAGRLVHTEMQNEALKRAALKQLGSRDRAADVWNSIIKSGTDAGIIDPAEIGGMLPFNRAFTGGARILQNGKWVESPQYAAYRQAEIAKALELNASLVPQLLKTGVPRDLVKANEAEVFLNAPKVPHGMGWLGKKAKKYKSGDDAIKDLGIAPEWGTANQYAAKNPFRKELDDIAESGDFTTADGPNGVFAKVERWEMEQVGAGKKPAFMADGNIAEEEIARFADENNLFIGQWTSPFNGEKVTFVAKDEASFNKVLKAKDQRKLGMALGYKSIGKPTTREEIDSFIRAMSGEATGFFGGIDVERMADRAMKEIGEAVNSGKISGAGTTASSARATYINSFFKALQEAGTPTTFEEYARWYGEMEQLSNRIANYHLWIKLGSQNPYKYEDYIQMLATENARRALAANSPWFTEARDAKAIAEALLVEAPEDAVKIQAELAQIRAMKDYVSVAADQPILPRQARFFSYSLLPEITAYAKYGPQGFERFIQETTRADKAMKLWKMLTLFRVSSQGRMLSDEGSRAFDQGFGLQSMRNFLGVKGLRQSAPSHILNDEGHKILNIFRDFDTAGDAFVTMGLPGEKAVIQSHEAMNYYFGKFLGEGYTKTIIDEYLAEEALAEGGGRVYLMNRYKEAAKYAGTSDLVAGDPALNGISRMLKLTGRGSDPKAAKQAAEAFDDHLRLDLRLATDTKVQDLYHGISGGKRMTAQEFESLRNSGFKLPVFVAPKSLGYGTANSSKRGYDTAKSLVRSGANAAFSPLQRATQSMQIAGYNHFYAEGMEKFIPGAMKAKQRAEKAARASIKEEGKTFASYEDLRNGKAVTRGTDLKEATAWEMKTADNIAGIPSEVLQQAERMADKYATERVREATYRAYRTAFEHRIRNVAPFFTPWRDFAQYWSKAIVERPSRGALLAAFTQAVPDKETSRRKKDVEQGLERYLPDWTVPTIMKGLNAAGMDSMGDDAVLSINFNNATFFTGGVNGMIPQVGPFVTMPIAELAPMMGAPGLSDFIGKVPGFGFVDSDSPLLGPLDKMLYAFTGHNLPAPLGYPDEKMDAKYNREFWYQHAQFTQQHDGRAPTDKETEDLWTLAHEQVDTENMFQFVGQYFLPTGFQSKSESYQMSNAISSWTRAEPDDRKLVEDVFMGRLPKEQLPQELQDEIFFMETLPSSQQETFGDIVRYYNAPDHFIEGMVVPSKDDIKALNPNIIPWTGRTMKYDQKGKDWIPLNEQEMKEQSKELMGDFRDLNAKQVAKIADDNFTKWLGSVALTTPGGELGQMEKDRLTNTYFAGNAEDMSGLTRQEKIHSRAQDSGKPSEAEQGAAAMASAQSVGGGNISAESDALNTQNPAYAAAQTYMQAEETKQYINAAEKAPLERGMAENTILGRPVTDAYTAGLIEFWQAEKGIRKQMEEQGITASSKDGKAMLGQLDVIAQDLSAKYGDSFTTQYKESKDPAWTLLMKLQFGLDDPAVAASWTQAYGILDNMTKQMADLTKSKDKDAVYKAAMAQIDALKTENKKFADQFKELNKETTKPTTAQLRAYKGDYATNAPKKGGKGRRGRKGGRRGGSKRIGSRIGAVKKGSSLRKKKKLKGGF